VNLTFYLDTRGIGFTRDIIRGFTSFLLFVANLHVAKHVDIDGFPEEVGQSPAHERYMKTVAEARVLVRTLEATTQAIYDDNSALLATAQTLPAMNTEGYTEIHKACCVRLDSLLITLEANTTAVVQTLEKLASLGSAQAEMADGEYRQSIKTRMSKIIVIEDTLRPLVSSKVSHEAEEDDVMGMEDALGYASQKPGRKVSPYEYNYKAGSDHSHSPTEYSSQTPTWEKNGNVTDSLYDADTTTLATNDEDLSPVDEDDRKLSFSSILSLAHVYPS
jgi:son of sevenless